MKNSFFVALAALVLAGSAQATSTINFTSGSGLRASADLQVIAPLQFTVSSSRTNWLSGSGLTMFQPDTTSGSGISIRPPGPGAAAIPEPDVWALLVIGFGAVGVLARRRSVALTA